MLKRPMLIRQPLDLIGRSFIVIRDLKVDYVIDHFKLFFYSIQKLENSLG